MVSRMDKYKEEKEMQTRSDKNKQLYKQVYNAYDEFENLVVPSNAKEINLSDLKKEITSRDDYRKIKEYSDVTNNKLVTRKEKIATKQKEENEIYDIKELLNKAVNDQKKTELAMPTITNGDYLKKLKLDNSRTNIEQVKEIYEEIKEEVNEEDESLLMTANLSLEILSDLKSDNDETMINPPIKEEELPNDIKDMDFYSNTYKFSKKDFEDKNINNEDDEFVEDSSNGKFFFKILLLILGIVLVVVVSIYLISYFNRV